MESLSLTALRKRLFPIVDQVLDTGIPVEIERKGRKLLIVPVDRSVSKLANLRKRQGIVGDPDELVDIKVGEWSEPKKLK
jgi:prevent-host-death family protein